MTSLILNPKSKKPLKVLSPSGIRGTKFTSVYNFPAELNSVLRLEYSAFLNFGVTAVRGVKITSRLSINIAVLRKVVLQKCKSARDNAEKYYG